MYQNDPGTAGVMMIGEIGGSAEEEAAGWIKKNMTSLWPDSLPGARRLRAAAWDTRAAIVSGSAGTAEGKVAAMRDAGIAVCDSPSDMGATLMRKMGRIK